MAEAKSTDKKVQASPVTNRPRMEGGRGYVKNYSNPNAILRGLAKFEPALGNLMNKIGSKQHREQATKDFKEGKGPSNTADNYMVVYGKLQGEKKAIDFHNELNAYLSENPNAGIGAYETTKASLLKKYAEGLEGYSLDSFLPDAVRSVGRADAKYQEIQIDYLKRDFSGNISAVAADGLGKTMEKNAPENLAQAMRDDLTRMQGEYVKGPLNRKEISQSYLRAIGYRAEVEGRPELLDFADIKDKNGVSLMDTDLAEEVRTYRNRAEENRDAAKTRQKAEKAEFIGGKMSELNAALHITIEDPKLSPEERNAHYKAIEDQMLAYSFEGGNPEGVYLPQSYVAAMSKTIRAYKHLDGFAPISDGNTYRDLMEQGDELSLESIAGSIHRLSKDDYTKFMGIVQRREKKDQTKDGRENNKMMNEFKRTLMGSMASPNPFGWPFQTYTNHAERKWMATRLWYDTISGLEKELKDGEFLTSEQVQEISQKIQKDVNLAIPAGPILGDVVIGGTGGGTATPQNPDAAAASRSRRLQHLKDKQNKEKETKE